MDTNPLRYGLINILKTIFRPKSQSFFITKSQYHSPSATAFKQCDTPVTSKHQTIFDCIPNVVLSQNNSHTMNIYSCCFRWQKQYNIELICAENTG